MTERRAVVGRVLLTATALCAAVLVGAAPLVPPAIAPATAPAAEFSAARAWRHVEAIGRAPRAIGSPGHAAAREYIVRQMTSLRIDTGVQEASRLIRVDGAGRMVTVRNVVGRMPGAQSSGAVLMVAHYDTVPMSPGAADNGAGVATLLETARALRTTAPPRNDLVWLFTDAEEVGLLGAQAFLAEHPLAARIGVVLNLDARGSTGPAVVFETGAPRPFVTRALATMTPRPMTTSFSDAVRRYVPYGTDFTRFREAGLPGLNIAFFAGPAHYHRASDVVEHLDRRSVQHQGIYVLALAKIFGALDLRAETPSRAVFFSVGPFGVWSYSEAWALPLAGFAAAAWGAAIAVGARTRRLTWRGLMRGATAIGLTVLAAAAASEIVRGGWILVAGSSLGWSGGHAIYLTALSLLSMLLSLLVCRSVGRTCTPLELVLPALACWAALSIVTSVGWRGASYLFVWPTLFGLVMTALAMAPRREPGRPLGRLSIGWLLLGAAPAVVLLTPIAALVQIVGETGTTLWVMAGATLVAMLVVPALGTQPDRSDAF